ncbi:MAG: hypothetical protein R3B49_02135 [Phycisphaerales bacterium]
MHAREHLGRTRDARGRSVTLLDPLGQWVRGTDTPIDPAALRRVIESLGEGDRDSKRWRAFGIACVVVVVLVVASVIAVDFLRTGRYAVRDYVVAGVTAAPGVVGGLVGGVVVPVIIARRRRMKRARAVLLGHRVCAHCGYGLEGVPAADTVVLCPECACAWSTEEVGRTPDTGPDPAFHRRRLAMGIMLAIGVVALILAAGVYVVRSG